MKPFAQYPRVHSQHPPTNLVFDAELRELLLVAIQPAALAAYTESLPNRRHHMHVFAHLLKHSGEDEVDEYGGLAVG